MKTLDTLCAGKETLLRALRNVAAALLVVSVTITFVNVVMRYIARAPIFWADELALITFVAVVFLSLGGVENRGEHLRLTILYQFFGEKVRIAGEYLRVSVSLVVGAYLASVGFNAAYQNFLLGNRTVALKLPTALTYSVLPIAFLTIAIVDALFLLKSLPRKKTTLGKLE